MQLQDIRKLAGEQVRANPDATSKVYCDSVRKNLITLLGQTDVVELTGNVDAFGGDRDVAANIGKAMFGLFCLAERLGIDAERAVEAAVSGITGQISRSTETQKPAEVTTPAKVEPGQPQEEEKSAPAIESPQKPEEKSKESSAGKGRDEAAQTNGKVAKIAMYSRLFIEAKDREEIDKVWKSISADKDLDGKEKFAFQGDKKSALERIAA